MRTRPTWVTWARPLVLTALLTVAISSALPLAPSIAAPPSNFQTSLVVGEGLDEPSGFEIAPDGRPAMPDNNFSVRWTKTQYFGAGRYKFTTVTDDGVRLYIDNKRVIDHWESQSATEYTYVADLRAGNHTIRMDYVEFGGGAPAYLTWDSTLDEPNEFCSR